MQICADFVVNILNLGYGLVMSYQTIIDAIDAAVEKWAGRAVSITGPNGGVIMYRSLDELTRARKTYENLLNRDAGTGGPRLGKITAGGR